MENLIAKVVAGITLLSTLAGGIFAADRYDTAKVDKVKVELSDTLTGMRLTYAQDRIDQIEEELEYFDLPSESIARKQLELKYRSREVDTILREYGD
jgi:hypothetical protein